MDTEDHAKAQLQQRHQLRERRQALRSKFIPLEAVHVLDPIPSGSVPDLLVEEENIRSCSQHSQEIPL